MREFRLFDAPIVQVRFARPTLRLDPIVTFYRDHLGLPELLRFSNHGGYDGVVLGLPDGGYQLEFTQFQSAAPLPAPSPDNLLVLYVSEPAQLSSLTLRLTGHGHVPVQPENPYWAHNSVTFKDPDGYRVVVCGHQRL